MNLYNEFDPAAGAWLGELIKEGLIPDGKVDGRSIRDVSARDLHGATQCHFFAGIGGWSEALRIAGWPADQPVWTGSCPCQPFSSAGKQRGTEDERHLWPEFRRLIAECRPPVVFGEQVASSLGREWLAGVRADLEALGYAVGAADLCAPGVGAPHIRQRLYWGAVRLADGIDPRLEGHAWHGDDRNEPGRDDPSAEGPTAASRGAGGLGYSVRGGLEVPPERDCEQKQNTSDRGSRRSDADGPDFWGGTRWHLCRDRKYRRVPDPQSSVFGVADGLLARVDDLRAAGVAFEPGLWPLATKVKGRVSLLRGYGNAIVPPLAAVFIRSFVEALHVHPPIP